ncbi:DUF2975 domain-containing protein [Chryseobacterium sp. JAH]|uniref:DUF2975 domain-containing protein n=1 Tax=Chryseobacterium sp. JAH TaxID=1742858 RepID=UPI000741306C|nr:DUF2975 domain-containing protein [Chryseobacterium sp. JAH]KUJ50444.1 hypothetical protein AR685_14170 [Chryseobacterium sp. JAH]
MKLLGKQSVSTIISYLFLALFIFFFLHFIYQSFGFGIGYYNWTTSHHIFSETFYVNDEIDYASYEKGKYLFFRFKYPYSNQQMMTGFFTLNRFVFHTFQSIFFCLFFFYGYKTFEDLSQQELFNETIIKHLKTFSVINLLYAPLYFLIWIFIFRSGIESGMFMTSFAFLFLGIILHFITVFFKRGFQLQSENDLTI